MFYANLTLLSRQLNPERTGGTQDPTLYKKSIGQRTRDDVRPSFMGVQSQIQRMLSEPDLLDRLGEFWRTRHSAIVGRWGGGSVPIWGSGTGAASGRWREAGGVFGAGLAVLGHGTLAGRRTAGTFERRCRPGRSGSGSAGGLAGLGNRASGGAGATADLGHAHRTGTAEGIDHARRDAVARYLVGLAEGWLGTLGFSAVALRLAACTSRLGGRSESVPGAGRLRELRQSCAGQGLAALARELPRARESTRNLDTYLIV